MSVAHDFDPVAEEKRKELARAVVRKATEALQALRSKVAELEAGDPGTWQEARYLAQEVIRGAGPLGLGLMSACAKEVLLFADRRFATESVSPQLALIMLSALDTLEMEVSRLRADHNLR